MQTSMARLALNLALAGATVISLSACSSAELPRSNLVAQAYETSGVISISPYTRTIFSSSNF